MALDGFSMGNLGLNTEMTAAQIAGQAEHLAQKEGKFEVKTMTKSAKEEGLKRKNKDDDGSSKNKSNSNKNKNDETEEPQNDFNKFDIKELEQGNIKDFSIRINETTNMVELVNIKDNRIMESIDADDLMNVFSKLNHASGIFVNRKI